MTIFDRGAMVARPSVRRRLMCGGALAALVLAPSVLAAQSQSDDTLRLLSLNVWHRFDQNPAGPVQFIAPGDYDVVMLQEAGANTRYVSHMPDLLEEAGAGTYTGVNAGSSAILSRVPGSVGTYTLPGVSSQGRNISWARVDGAAGRPETLIGSVHFDYSDEPGRRQQEARALNDWAQSQTGPLIMAGDFNAGDVSERGLHRAEQQSYLYARVLMRPNSSQLWRDLAQEYTPEGREDEFAAYTDAMRAVEGNGQQRYMNVLEDYFAANRDEFPGISSINNMSWRQWEYIIAQDMAANGLTFEDETLPVASNTPVTLNLLKKQFIMLQTAEDREAFAPHALGDASGTWPSQLEDRTNTWNSWDRVQIDHFLASRPFGKWFAIADDPEDPYLGVITGVEVVDGNGNTVPLSDHEPVAHDFRWVGPRLETFGDDDSTRIAWDSEATTWEDSDGEFLLTRNNMRQDLYLSQISDENGQPIFTDLTEAEQKTLLDCTTTDARFQQAVAEYCIDDHSFIAETLVADGGTVAVTEDAALGGEAAQLRLNDGGLAVLGTEMTELGRDVALEGAGGWLDVRDAEAAVTASGVISGTGALSKRGAGQLVLSGDNSYTGTTSVEAGTLVVNGSIAQSGLLTVGAGATLGGSGTTASVAVSDGGTLGAGNSIGTLTVDGDLTFSEGANFVVEADADGNADRVDVTGQTTINGGSVVVLAEGGDYAVNTDYQILTSQGGITGRFDAVRSELAFLDGALTYGDTGLGLSLERNDTAFRTLAASGNARSVADAIDALGTGNALYDDVVMLGGATARAAFDDLSGELNAAAFGALAAQSVQVAEIWRHNDSAPEQGASVWISGYGDQGTTSGEGDLRDVNRNSAGTLLGLNAVTEDGLQLALMTGFGAGQLSLDGQDGQIDTTDLHLGLSLGAEFGATTLRGGASYARSTLSGHRDVTVAGTTDRLSIDGAMATTQVFVEAAHRMTLGGVALEPFAQLAHVRVTSDGLRETGGAAALSLSDDSYDASYGEIGARLQTVLGDSGATRLSADLGYRHGLSGETAKVSGAFAGGESFDIMAAGMAGDVATVAFGLEHDLSKGAVLSAGYAGAFGEGKDASALNLGIGITF